MNDLLERDIDELTSLAAGMRSDDRDAWLITAADALARDVHESRLKLLRFVQALAAAPEPTLSDRAVETGVRALIIAAHATDPSARLSALRALAVVASRARELTVAVNHTMLATFEYARIDAAPAIQAFANEVLSTNNPVFRRLISLEVAIGAVR